MLRSGIADLERVERLTEFAESGVAAGIGERMQPDQQPMLFRLREDVGAREQHLADEGSPVVLGLHVMRGQTPDEGRLGAMGDHLDGAVKCLASGMPAIRDVTTDSVPPPGMASIAFRIRCMKA